MRYQFDEDDSDEDDSDEDDDFAESDEDDEDSDDESENDDVETWQVTPGARFSVIPLKVGLQLTSRLDLLDWPQFPSSAGTPRPARIPTA